MCIIDQVLFVLVAQSLKSRPPMRKMKFKIRMKKEKRGNPQLKSCNTHQNKFLSHRVKSCYFFFMRRSVTLTALRLISKDNHVG